MANIGQGLSGAASGAATGTAVAGPVGGIVGGVLGGLGGLFSGGGPSPEEIAAQNLQNAYANEAVATPEQRQIQLQYLKSVGQLTPAQEAAINQSDTQMKNINVDPRLKSAQMQALTNLEQQGKTGLTLEDRSALMDAQRQAAQQNQGQQQAILQNAAMRGMGGSGAELAARLQASQGSADQAAQSGLRVAAQAQQARMAALQNAGNMAGQMGATQFGQQAQVQGAQDVINRFNTGNAQSVQQRNVANQNQAQQYNLDYAKNLEQNRVNTMNNQQAMDKQATLDYYNQLNQKNLGAAGAGVQAGAAESQANQRGAQQFGGIMSGIGAAANAAKNAGVFNSKPDAAGGTTGYSGDYMNMKPEDEFGTPRAPGSQFGNLLPSGAGQ